jgi:hypothetical protein
MLLPPQVLLRQGEIAKIETRNCNEKAELLGYLHRYEEVLIPMKFKLFSILR